MINTNMREYDYYTYGDLNGYGQPALSEEVKGKIKMSVFVSSQSVQDNINYKNAQLVGLTHNKDVSDKYVIDIKGVKYKVLYVNPQGKYNQVFLGAYE